MAREAVPMSLPAVARLTWCQAANVNDGDATMPLTIADKTVLVTGANRGLGRALVDEALRRGAKRVYAASRGPMVVADQRVTPLILDVTDPAQIQKAADSVESLDILINNAGVSDEPSYLIFASNGGAPSNPDWYHNLKAHPNTRIDVAGE